MEEAPRRFNIRDYLRLLQKRKWLIIVIFAGAVTLAGLAVSVQEESYQATAYVLVRRAPAGLLLISGDNPRLPDTLSLQTQAEKAESIKVAQAAWAQLELAKYPTIPDTPEELRRTLSAEPSEPDMVIMRATTRSERDAVQFVNAAASGFAEVSRTDAARELEEARKTIDAELAKVNRALRQVEERTAQYQQETGIIDPAEVASLRLTALADYRRMQADARAGSQEATEAARALRQELDEQPETEALVTPLESPVVTQLRLRLAAKRAELAEARARYTPENQRLQQLEDEVQELEGELRLRSGETVEQTTVTPNPARTATLGALTDAEARAAGLRAREGSLGGVVREYQRSIEDLPEKQAELARLLADAEFHRQARISLQDRLQDVTIRKAMQPGNVEVLSTATAAPQVAPQAQKTLLFAGLLGLLAGFGVAFLLEVLDNTIRTADELTGPCAVPFLGMIPWMENDRPMLVTVSSPKSPPAEAYRTLRSNINFSMVDGPAKTLLVTSAGAGEGKSLTAANLAVAMAQAGQSVLLADTDLRRPALHRLFDVEPGPGLTNVLVGDLRIEDVVQETQVPGLGLLASGPLPPNPAELLDSQRMKETTRAFREGYDLVILDSPPAIVLTDAIVLAAQADATLLVAESGKVTREAFAEMRRLIERARGHILGAVINKLRLAPSDYYYYYYYYDNAGRDGLRA